MGRAVCAGVSWPSLGRPVAWVIHAAKWQEEIDTVAQRFDNQGMGRLMGKANAAKIIEKVRRRMGVSREGLSWHLNATKGAVQHWERGWNHPELARLMALRQICPPGAERKLLDALIKETQDRILVTSGNLHQRGERGLPQEQNSGPAGTGIASANGAPQRRGARFRARGGILGLTAMRTDDLASQIQRGLPFRALESLVALTGLSLAVIASVLRIPERTLARRKGAGRLAPDESERLLRIATAPCLRKPWSCLKAMSPARWSG